MFFQTRIAVFVTRTLAVIQSFPVAVAENRNWAFDLAAGTMKSYPNLID